MLNKFETIRTCSIRVVFVRIGLGGGPPSRAMANQMTGYEQASEGEASFPGVGPRGAH